MKVACSVVSPSKKLEDNLMLIKINLCLPDYNQNALQKTQI